MEVINVTVERDTIGFRFPEVGQPGREVVKFQGVRKSYGSTVVYERIDAQLMRGQRVAVVGMNGAGKTTLLKLLADELTPDAGTITLGHNVTMGYFAQHHAETLDKTHTILEEMMPLVPDKPQAFIRSVLGSFLFTKDDVDKKIGVLSGGERARVALARLLLKPANLLVMDEPTNHLDLDSTEALIEALEAYGGTIIFVSHNRAFLDALATHVWDVRDKKLVPWPGNLADYLHHLELENATRERAEESATEAPAKIVSEKDRKRIEAEQRQARSAKTAPLKKEFTRLETRIETLETEQKQREAQLEDADFAADFAKAGPVMQAHAQARQELETLYSQWESVGAELEAANAS